MRMQGTIFPNVIETEGPADTYRSPCGSHPRAVHIDLLDAIYEILLQFATATRLPIATRLLL